MTATKIKDFLYMISPSMLDYRLGMRYYRNANIAAPGACSTVRKGSLFGRNFDWTYDNSNEYIVKTKRSGWKYATIGVATHADDERVIPFRLVDGINECGVAVSTNIVPNQYGKTTGTEPAIFKDITLCSLMLPRYILDKFDTAKNAVAHIRDYVSVYCSKTLYEQYGYDTHIMVADGVNTYVLEFVNNATVIIDITGKPYMTNFFLHGVTFNADGSVYTPYTKSLNDSHDAMLVNGITSHGSGLERYNLINSLYQELNTKNDMRSLLTDLKYTNAYSGILAESEKWFTEGVGEHQSVEDLTVSSPLADCETIYSAMQALFADRSRDTGETWQSVHSAIYDLKNKSLSLVTQEDNVELKFDFNMTIEEIIQTAEEQGTQSSVLVGELAKVVKGDSESAELDAIIQTAEEQGTQSSVLVADLAKVVKGDSESEELDAIIQTAEEQGTQSSVLVLELANYIKDNPPAPAQELYVPPTIDGDTNPVLSEGTYHAYYVLKTDATSRSAKLMKGGVEVAGGATVAVALSTITEQTVEAVPELAAYIGWKYDVVTVDASDLEAGDYSIEYTADGLSDDSLTFTVEEQKTIYIPTEGEIGVVFPVVETTAAGHTVRIYGGLNGTGEATYSLDGGEKKSVEEPEEEPEESIVPVSPEIIGEIGEWLADYSYFAYLQTPEIIDLTEGEHTIQYFVGDYSTEVLTFTSGPLS